MYFVAQYVFLWCSISLSLVLHVCVVGGTCILLDHIMLGVLYCITYRCVVLYHIQAHVLYCVVSLCISFFDATSPCVHAASSCFHATSCSFRAHALFLSCPFIVLYHTAPFLVPTSYLLILSCSYLSLSFFLQVSLFGAAKYCVVCGVLHVHSVVCCCIAK